MKRKFKIIVILLILFNVSQVKAYNYESSELRIYSIQDNFKICLKSDALKPSGEYNMYIWSSFNNDYALSPWPGISLVDSNNNDEAYCYTYTDDGEKYDNVIFNGNGKQTIDLKTINDSKGVINSLIYLFDESGLQNDGKYKGKWVVYDTESLKDMVTEAKNLKAKDYTISTYNSVKTALGDDVDKSDVNISNKDDYSLGADYVSQLKFNDDILEMLTVNYDSNNNEYSSEYLTKYNQLGTAMNNLVERKKIKVNGSINGGTVDASYKQNSDNSININITKDVGYELESLTVKKITSYDNSNNPIFGESTSFNVNSSNYEYSFNETEYDSNDMIGVYIDATFKKKNYNLKIDNKDYSFEYGTTYEQILNELELEKDGYIFLYFTDSEGNIIDDNYVVSSDNELFTNYKINNIDEVNNNPLTGSYIFKQIISILLFSFLLFVIIVKKNVKFKKIRKCR